ncbi:AAA family ATPase [Thermobifida halotolerans]|uniref:AAA family ATPase n=1 Tax=Thermobifida halotolerans TaxID=483545 RepID=UPI001F4097A5|nr:AAA family ATPase [Thermobifida halotolerans]
MPKVRRRTCADSAGRPSSVASLSRSRLTLSAEQHAVTERLTTGGHALDAVIGVAGAGKTTIMSAARPPGRRADSGWLGPTSPPKQASHSTVAAWLTRIDSSQILSGIDVLVIDEAAMLDDRALARLAEVTQISGIKLVVIGDPHQWYATGVGDGFAAVHKAVGGPVPSEARRQRDVVDQITLAQ